MKVNRSHYTPTPTQRVELELAKQVLRDRIAAKRQARDAIALQVIRRAQGGVR